MKTATFVLGITLSAQVSAVPLQFDYIGPFDGAYDDPSNWAGGMVPGTEYTDIVVNVPEGNRVRVSTELPEVESFVLNGDLLVMSGGSLNAFQGFRLNGDTVNFGELRSIDAGIYNNGELTNFGDLVGLDNTFSQTDTGILFNFGVVHRGTTTDYGGTIINKGIFQDGSIESGPVSGQFENRGVWDLPSTRQSVDDDDVEFVTIVDGANVSNYGTVEGGLDALGGSLESYGGAFEKLIVQNIWTLSLDTTNINELLIADTASIVLDTSDASGPTRVVSVAGRFINEGFEVSFIGGPGGTLTADATGLLYTPFAVPVPSAHWLLLPGLLGVGFLHRRSLVA